MDIVDALDQILQQRRRAGITNREMATQAGCSQPHINDLLNHTKKRKKKGEVEVEKEVSLADLKFETLLKLFPEVQAILEEHFAHQESPSATVVGNGSAAAVNGNATAAPVTYASPSPDRGKLTSAVLNDDAICDACKVRVLKLLQDS